MTEEDLYDALAQMLLAMEGTYQEIWECHCYLVANEELYLSCWALLDAPFRRAWVGYLDDYRESLGESSSLLGPFGPGVR